jgi:hypothetical protein
MWNKVSFHYKILPLKIFLSLFCLNTIIALFLSFVKITRHLRFVKNNRLEDCGDGEGLILGDRLGEIEGDNDGEILGLIEGDSDGEMLGEMLGLIEGLNDGLTD